MTTFIIGFISGILFVELNKYLANEFEELCEYFIEGDGK